LQEKNNTLLEYKAVLTRCNRIFGFGEYRDCLFRKSNAQNIDVDLRGKDLDDVRGLSAAVKFNQAVGVINKEEEGRFQRMLFRVTKGNAWITLMDIQQPVGQ
jgi:V-type H+-transporting ATPase subunit a